MSVAIGVELNNQLIMSTLDIKLLNLRLERILMDAGFHVKRMGRQFHQFENKNYTVSLPAANYGLERHYIKIDHKQQQEETNSFSFDIRVESDLAEQAIEFLKFHTHKEHINAL